MTKKYEDTSKKLLHSALILTIAAIITKVLSAAYRIPYQNIAGDIGFYIYQQAYPFYGIALALSTLGFPVIISKLIAEKKEFSTGYSVQDILLSSFVVLSGLGGLLCATLYIGADWIALIMKDPNLAPLLKIISFSFLIMPVSSVLRGYYQGRNEMMPTAVSQIVEQFIRVSAILLFSSILIKKGYSLYEAGAGAVFGSIIGGVAGILILLTFVWMRKDVSKVTLKKLDSNHFSVITKMLLIQGFSFCLTSIILVLVQLVDAFQLHSLLIASGLGGTDAKVLKGVYDRGQPLIQLGTVVANSVSLSLVPIISSLMQKKRAIELQQKIQLAFKVSLTIGLGASVGLACIIKPTNYMLYTDMNGSGTLAVLSFSILFTSLLMAMASILQSMGRFKETVWIVLLGIVAKEFLNVLLVPRFSIMGAAVATVSAFMIMTLLLYVVLKKQLNASILERGKLRWLLAGTVAMAVVLIGYDQLFTWMGGTGRAAAAVQALSGVMAGGLVFVFIIIRKGLFNLEELALIPFGSKLVLLLKDNNHR